MDESKNSYERIYDVVKRIPKGKVATYGQIAMMAGNERWSRVVGYALHVNPDPQHIPCHRVVNRYGEVSAAFAFGGSNRQITLLAEEGVESEDGKVDLARYQWKPGIDPSSSADIEEISGKRKRIEVAAAVICDGDRIFAAQRRYGEFKDGWEFPGGKLEAGETPEEALVREIREELDTGIEVGQLIDTVEYDYPQFHLTMHCFFCTVRSGDFMLKEHKAAKWLTKEMINSVDWLPADVDLIQKLKRIL